MNWWPLTSDEELALLLKQSEVAPQIIFKHSTRCSISVMAKGRLEREAKPDGVIFHYLDLLQYRNISSSVSDAFQVHHESPQVLMIWKGECIYDESHNAIDISDIVANLPS
jgi:bacillithiol system protein YtxJ